MATLSLEAPGEPYHSDEQIDNVPFPKGRVRPGLRRVRRDADECDRAAHRAVERCVAILPWLRVPGRSARVFFPVSQRRSAPHPPHRHGGVIAHTSTIPTFASPIAA